jgi:hypothetical protein
MSFSTTSMHNNFRTLLVIGTLLCTGCAVSQGVSQKNQLKNDQLGGLTNELIEKVSNQSLQKALQALKAGKSTIDQPFEFDKAKGKLEQVAPLTAVAYAGELEVVQVLLQAGADVHVKDADGDTPIMVASYAGRYEVVALLL